MKIGLYIVGDEILSGRRQDRHLNFVTALLQKYGLRLGWVAILADDLELLEQNFRSSLARRDFVLSAGGIGGTPDDLTRMAMANALGVDLAAHAKALPILQRKFSRDLSAHRLRMIEFPVNAELIPNPVNEVPGFYIADHHFVPGFPEMAQPMFEWVMQNCLPDSLKRDSVERALIVLDCPESKLIPLMEQLMQDYATIKVFSLPNIKGSNRSVELGVRGTAEEVEGAFKDMQASLKKLAVSWRMH